MPASEPARPWITRPFKKCASLGVGVALAGLVLMAVFPAGAPELPRGFFTPILAFELIQDKAEVLALFGREGSPAREGLVARMDLGNELDFVFMALYGAFLFCFGLEAWRATGGKLPLLACPAAVAVTAADVLENVQLLGITQRLASGDFDLQLSLLRLFTWAKWAGIVAAFLVLLPFAARAGRLGKAAAALMLASACAGAAAFFFPGLASEIFFLSIQASFVLLISLSFAWPSSAAGSGSPQGMKKP